MSFYDDETRDARMSVGECPDAPDHEVYYADGIAHCRACGAEFLDEDGEA